MRAVRIEDSASVLRTKIRWAVWQTAFGSSLFPVKLTGSQVELWLREIPLAPKSKRHVKATLFALIEFAMWAGILPVGRNPMELVSVKGVTKRIKPRRILSVDEFLRLLAELKEHFRLIIIFSVCFGLRISEALALKWSDVDWLKGTLNIEVESASRRWTR